MIFVIIKMFGIIVSVAGPVPYTMEECIESLSVLTHLEHVPTEFSCEPHDVRPVAGVLSSEQIEILNRYYPEPPEIDMNDAQN